MSPLHPAVLPREPAPQAYAFRALGQLRRAHAVPHCRNSSRSLSEDHCRSEPATQRFGVYGCGCHGVAMDMRMPSHLHCPQIVSVAVLRLQHKQLPACIGRVSKRKRLPVGRHRHNRTRAAAAPPLLHRLQPRGLTVRPATFNPGSARPQAATAPAGSNNSLVLLIPDILMQQDPPCSTRRQRVENADNVGVV